MKYLPQISRKLTASLTTWLEAILRWGGLIMIIWSSMMVKNETARRRELTQIPVIGAAHEELAKNYWRKGEEQLTRQELEMVQGSDGKGVKTEVLGATTGFAKLKEWQEEETNLQSQLGFWKQIAEKYPSYRDGYLMQGYYAIKTSERETARSAIAAAMSIDPNDTRGRELQRYLEETR